MRDIFNAIAGILMLVTYIPYVVTMVRRHTKPSRATWLIWASVDSLATASMYAGGVLNAQIAAATMGSCTIALLCFSYGKRGWTRLDTVCVLGAVVGIALWQLLSNPLYAIVSSQTVMLIGSVPTVESAWKNPAHEDTFAWTLGWTSCVFELLAISAWTVESSLQPLTFMAIETVMMYILYLRPRPVS